MSELLLDVALANKLKRAMKRNNIPDVADVDWLASGDNIAKVRCVRLGYAEIVILEHMIDCTANPSVPVGWELVEHQKGGVLKWDKESQKNALYLSKGQQSDKYIEGNLLRKELQGRAVLNANVLDHLLDHPHLIPEEWKNKLVFFWGTIYRYRDGNLFVPYLGWYDSRWLGGARSLGCGWDGDYPAALSAS